MTAGLLAVALAYLAPAGLAASAATAAPKAATARSQPAGAKAGHSSVSAPVLDGKSSARPAALTERPGMAAILERASVGVRRVKADSGTGTISGTVDAAGSSPLSGVCVTATATDGANPGGNTVTAADGTYSIASLPVDSYTVEFDSVDCGGTYLTQYYPDQQISFTAVPVNVASGATTSGIDAVMDQPGTISGTVTALGGSALAGVCVMARTTNGVSFVPGTTAADGTYSITGLDPGVYNVEFTANGCATSATTYVTEYYPNQESNQDAGNITVESGATVSGINVAMYPTGSISGTVTAAAGGAGVSEICVTATESNDVTVGTTITAPNGTYTIPGLDPGSYTVLFSNAAGCGNTGSWLSQYYPNQLFQQGASVIQVSSGVTTTGINDRLYATSTISGTVTASPGGAGLSGICVTAALSGGGGVSTATTSTVGAYSVTGLAPGVYTVQFTSSNTCGTAGYVGVYYPNALTLAAAALVPVSIASTTSGINESLGTGGSISGTVTSGGTGVAGICVTANSVDGAVTGNATTASGGTYTISGLAPDTYTVEFADGCGQANSYVTQFYNNQPQGPGNDVSVTQGATTQNINAILVETGSISGTVTDASTAADLSSICVTAFGSGGFTQETITGADGTYSDTGLPAGSYSVEFSNQCGSLGTYSNQWYQDEFSAGTADPVSVTAGATTSGINAALTAGSTLEGTVTAAAGGAPLVGICVSVTDAGDDVFNAMTASDGTYAVPGLDPGAYTVQFNDCGFGTYQTQYYNDQASAQSATPVDVSANATVTGIDAALVAVPLGSITGNVTAANGGSQLSGICVSALGPDGQPAGETATGLDGSYTISALPDGPYTVEFATGCGEDGNFVTQYYNGQTSAGSATAVTVSGTGTTSDINAAMAAGGTITGTVTSGTDPTGFCVTATSAAGTGTGTTGLDGAYTIASLPAGSYTVSFSNGDDNTCGFQSGFLTQYYSGAASAESATPVTVIAAGTTTGINATMQTGGTISGTVTASAGGGDVVGVCVTATLTTNSSVMATTVTGLDGTYAIAGLSSGSYIVEFTNGCGAGATYVDQFYADQSSSGTANPVAVTAGATTSGINATLAPSGIQLVFTTQPGGGTAGTAWATQPVVTIENATGAPITSDTSAITLGIQGGTGTAGATLSGCSATTVAGVARFSGCKVNLAGSGYELQASDATDGLSATSGTFGIAAGAPSQLAFTAQPGGGPAGSAWVNQPTVAVEDAEGNTVTTDSSAVTLAIKAGTGTAGASLSGCSSTTTAGVAKFSGCQVNLAGTGYELQASDATDVLSGTSGAFGISAGPPAKLVFTAQPGGAVAGKAWTGQPAVTIEDAEGNTVSTDVNAVTLAIKAGTGTSGATLSGCSATTSGGVAHFSGCQINDAGSSYVLQASDATDVLSTTSSAFNVIPQPPTVTKVSPADGPSSGGTLVTVTGTNLLGPTSVHFGTVAATVHAVVSSTEIQVIAPKDTGTVDITVTTAGGTSAKTTADHYIYVLPPTVTKVSPGNGPSAGGTLVTITGANLAGPTAVHFGTVLAKIDRVVSAAEIQVTAPKDTGTVDITVTTVGGTSAKVVADHFAYVLPPTVTKVSPNKGPTTGGTLVIITGTNLAGPTAVHFGTVLAKIDKVVSAAEIEVTSPKGAGTVDITVTTVGGTSAKVVADRFTY